MTKPLCLKTKVTAFVLVLLMLNSCATAPSRPPATVEDRVIVDGEVLPLPEQPTITTEPLGGQAVMSPVANKLLVTSELQRNAGDWESAANSLERALRIEPRNALLWNHLAEIKYAQNNWQQAAQIAAKSNTLVGANKNLRRQNWYLMANAYQAMGDVASATKYRQKLSR